MSFYSSLNARRELAPGACSNAAAGLCERVCVTVNKVYDACMSQDHVDGITVTLTGITPTTSVPVQPLTFISCQSEGVKGTLRDVVIERLTNRENFARVRATVDIPISVVFTDATGKEFSGLATVTVLKDVILFVPNESVIPFFLDNVASAICVAGTQVSGFTFTLSVCVTVILKIVAEVDLLMPSYGFCAAPPCEEFAENICDEFFGLPIFPQQLPSDVVPC